MQLGIADRPQVYLGTGSAPTDRLEVTGSTPQVSVIDLTGQDIRPSGSLLGASSLRGGRGGPLGVTADSRHLLERGQAWKPPSPAAFSAPVDSSQVWRH